MPYYNPGIGQMSGPMSIVDNMATHNWYTARTVSVDTSNGADLVALYPHMYCLQLEDASHSGHNINATYWDQSGSPQLVSFANSQYVTPRQPWITRIDATNSTAIATAVKCYFVDKNPNLS